MIFMIKLIVSNYYRDTLKRNYTLRKFYIEVEMEDLAGFDETLADKLMKLPSEHLAIFEEAAKEVADEITAPRPDNEEVEDIQVLLTSGAIPSNIRDMKVVIVIFIYMVSKSLLAELFLLLFLSI